MPWPYPAPKPAPERVKLGQLIKAALKSVEDVPLDEKYDTFAIYIQLADAEDALHRAITLAEKAEA